MQTIVIGAYSSTNTAEDAFDSLTAAGYNANDIGIVAKKGIIKDDSSLSDASDSTGARVAEGAMSGATTGGVIGGLAGLIIGLTAITIPGLGAILIGGPIVAALGLTGAAATAVSGATTGAAAGGLIGAFAGLGLPDETVRHYDEKVRGGGVILAIPVEDDAEAAEVRQTLESNGAEDVTTVHTKK